MSFEFMISDKARQRLETAYASITNNDLWDWLRNYDSRNRAGCIFNDHPNFKIIEKSIYAMVIEQGLNSTIIHDGYSWNWTMNIMEYIASNSIDAFRTNFIEPTISL